MRTALVTYPAGATTGEATVVHVAPAGEGRTAVILDSTPFHPVDTAWPDQPSDRGTIQVRGTDHEILDGVIGAWHDDEFFLGADVPVRTGSEGWTFAVAQIVSGDGIRVGDAVTVRVDVPLRAALSSGHTACHLASLALDAALAGAWRKDAPRDARGEPAFDALAIQESRILPDGSRDVYRIGKSLRRKGFDPSALDDLDALTARVDEHLAEWIAGGGAVRVDADGPALADRRTWVCALPDGEVRIPCGGTHAGSLADFASITTAFETGQVDGGVVLEMTTTAIRH